MLRGGYALALQPSRHVGLLRRVRRQSGRRDRRRSRNHRRQHADHGRRAACRCCSATANRLGPAPFPTTRRTPFTEVITGDVNIFDPEPAGAVLADLDGGHPAQAHARHRRSRCATSARATSRRGRTSTTTKRTSSRTGSSNEFRQRAGQPAGEHRRRAAAADVRVLRAGHRARRRCRSTWRTSTASPRRGRAMRRGTRRRSWTSTELHQSAGDVQPESVHAGAAPTRTPAWTAIADAPRECGRAPACR